MRFRQAVPEEAEAVYEIIVQGKHRLAAQGLDQWQGKRPNKELIEQDIAAERSYVVERADGLVGTLVLSGEGEACYDDLSEGRWLTDSSSSDPTYLVVHRIAVADRALGEGVARYMLDNAERVASERGFTSVRIDTHPDNEAMLSLLTSCGYDPCGIVLLDEAFEEPTRERIGFEKCLGAPIYYG